MGMTLKRILVPSAYERKLQTDEWIPAFAGMTAKKQSAVMTTKVQTAKTRAAKARKQQQQSPLFNTRNLTMATDTHTSIIRDFIELALEVNALKFGDFTLKSGRQSPYFFNIGEFNTGTALAKLGAFYARKLYDSAIPFDVLLGPAYKGIPLALSTAIAYHHLYNKTIPYCFNRKEIKDHGEGGQWVGRVPTGKIVFIDDVITAGTAFRESMALLEKTPATLGSVLIALNRQESGTGTLSALEEIKKTYEVPVLSLITLDDLIDYLKEHPTLHIHWEKLKNHREKYR